ncbi:MAG: GTP pyrophosphokinase family protein [Lachnospiraceae bacterium]|nr:GTP pyrophosphokinase family protein [Lachnospiraceae bacterium]
MPTEYNIAELVQKLGNNKEIFESAKEFQDMMMRYECAAMEIETKIKILNEEFSLRTQRNPIESIKSRIKSPASIYEKMSRKGYDMTIEAMEQHLSDIAGVRVICSFPEDIYAVARLITEQDDIIILEIKDYIAKPKENGYRSLHLIVAVPIFLANEKRNMKVEIQFRTIAMDFWASLEHKVKYKKNVENPEEIARELKECADIITSVDYRMQEIEHKTSVIE